MKRLTHLLVLVAFIFSCGGQWVALQGIAWMNMIHDYAQFVPITQAVTMTLSGQYPCELCKAIEEKKANEQSKALGFEKYGKKFFPPQVSASNRLVSTPVLYPAYFASLLMRSDVPPTPPPRDLLS